MCHWLYYSIYLLKNYLDDASRHSFEWFPFNCEYAVPSGRLKEDPLYMQIINPCCLPWVVWFRVICNTPSSWFRQYCLYLWTNVANARAYRTPSISTFGVLMLIFCCGVAVIVINYKGFWLQKEYETLKRSVLFWFITLTTTWNILIWRVITESDDSYSFLNCNG